jgi:hypothetical protein
MVANTMVASTSKNHIKTLDYVCFDDKSKVKLQEKELI